MYGIWGGKFLEVNPNNVFKLDNKILLLDNNSKSLYEIPKKEYETVTPIKSVNYDEWLKNNKVPESESCSVSGSIYGSLVSEGFIGDKNTHSNFFNNGIWNIFHDANIESGINYDETFEIVNKTNENKYIAFSLILLSGNDKIINCLNGSTVTNPYYSITATFNLFITYLDTNTKIVSRNICTQEQISGLDEFGRFCFIIKIMMEPNTKLTFDFYNKNSTIGYKFKDDDIKFLIKVWCDGRCLLWNDEFPFNFVYGPKPYSIADMNTWEFPIYRKEDKKRLKISAFYKKSIEPIWTSWDDEILTI